MQSERELAPALGAAVPLGHALQADSAFAPSLSLKKPDGHLTHDASEVEGSAVE